MKKFCSFIILVLSMLSCVIFSACGDNYSNLKMSFYAKDGSLIEELVLVIDSSNENNSRRIGVKFSGIKEEQIGEVEIICSNDVATITEKAYEGDMVYVTITAYAPTSSNNTVTVLHKASGKKETLPLNVKLKANNLILKNENDYIISIPDQGENDHIIDAGSVVKLDPLSSSDKIYFKLMSNLPAGVTPIEAGNGYIAGFKVTSVAAVTNAPIEIVPVTVLEGYDPTEYLNKKINIHLKKTLNQDNVLLWSETYDVDEVIHLIKNDDYLSSMTIDLGYKPNIDDDAQIRRLADSDFMSYYQLVKETSVPGYVDVFEDSNSYINIKAAVYTEEVVTVTLKLVPIGFVGDVSTVTLNLQVKMDLRSQKITIKKNGQIVEGNDTTILDYYQEGNSLGSLFEFEAVTNSTLEVNEYLNKMVIVVDPEVLNASISSNDDKKNLIYIDNTFTTLSETDNYGSKVAGSKASLLSMYGLGIPQGDSTYSGPIKFYFDEISQKFISQEINSSTKVYIKYIGTAEGSDFGIELRTTYNNEIPYWSTIVPTVRPLTFHRQQGVYSLSLQAGSFDDDAGKVNIFDTAKLTTIYLNRAEGLDNENIDTKLLYIDDNAIQDKNGKQIAKAEFDVEINYDGDNPLKLYPDNSYKDTADNKIEGSTNFKFTYDLVENKNLLGFVFRKDTDIGEYVVTFSQEGVVKATIVCYVYESLTDTSNIETTFTTDLKAFKNTDYAEYDADYIISKGKEKLSQLQVTIPEAVISSHMLKGYVFTFEVGTDDNKLDLDKKTKYFNLHHDESLQNFATLDFLEGTHIGGENNYVYLTATVQLYQYDLVGNLSKETRNLEITTKFFIYEPITYSDIELIGADTTTKYAYNLLGYHDKEKSQASLQFKMNENLWDYVQEVDGGKIVWSCSSDIWSGVSYDIDNETNTIDLQFNKIINMPYTRVIKASITQFGTTFELEQSFTIKAPIITEQLRILSELKVDSNQNYYINLKKGDPYTVVAQNYSSLGDVTSPGIDIQVANIYGSASEAVDYFDVNKDTATITVTGLGSNNYQLIVFAKDALRYEAASDVSGYNNPTTFLMEGEGDSYGAYKRAYFVINIILSEGTEENPYLITSADEFWEINKSDELKTAHYKLMNSISLNNTTYTGPKTIDGFTGSIVTDNDAVMIVDGITLNNANSSLFTNFAGELSNISFDVNYDYDMDNLQTDDINLGLINVNNGTLTNVLVKTSGKAVLDGETTYNFGSLVGLNNATVQYTQGIGVSGAIELSGNADVKFGGLVGKNTGLIQGYETETTSDAEDKVVFGNESIRAGAISAISINSTLSNNSAIGGLVGLNTYGSTVGTIKNLFVQATINAATTSNVGGVIGQNIQQDMIANVEFDNFGINAIKLYNAQGQLANINEIASTSSFIFNVKSASVITAYDKVGGIVGYDQNGVYVECDYQVLTSDVTKTSSIVAHNNVGGIAGESLYGKFAYCSVMSYWWDYSNIKNNAGVVVTDVADIYANDYVGGIVGLARSVDGSWSGAKDVSNKTIVAYSSVNAYLQASAKSLQVEVGNIGGILTDNTNTTTNSILFNVYFIGKLQGALNYDEVLISANGVTNTHYLILDNNNSSIYNAVYSLNLEVSETTTNVKLGYVNDGSEFIITDNPDTPMIETPNMDFWGINNNINGGYIFITLDDDKKLPIFDLSPDNIIVNVKEGYSVEDTKKVLKLSYYDFSKNPLLDDQTINILNKENIKNITDLVSATYSPSGLGTVVVAVESSRTNIVDITYDGKLVVNGIGECELYFKSVLNSVVNEHNTIKVIVDYPIGEEFVLSTSSIDQKDVQEVERIGKGNSKRYYAITSGSVDINYADGTTKTYTYITKTDLNLKVEVSFATTDGTFKIQDYLTISGQTGVETFENNVVTLIVYLDKNTPLSVTVHKIRSSKNFSVKVTPYEVVNNQNVMFNTSKTFNLETKQGLTNALFSYSSAVLYPSDIVYATMYLTTDFMLSAEQIINRFTITDKSGNYSYEYNTTYERIEIDYKGQIIGYLYIDKCNEYNSDTYKQTVVIRVEFDNFELDNEESFDLNFVVDQGKTSVKYTILPERIDQIEIKNYYLRHYEDGVYSWELEDVLKPNTAGRIIVDIVPNNGYYSYLEISDITGSEEIIFIQVDENGNTLPNADQVSSDGKGIILVKPNGDVDVSRLYVKTQISSRYTSKPHTVQVRAYSKDGILLSSYKKIIDVKMLPTIDAEYLLPNGQVSAGVATNEELTGLYLANGVDTNFKVVTANSNSGLDVEITIDGTTTTDYQFKHVVDNLYVLESLNVNSANIGKVLKLTMKTYSVLDNGDYEEAMVSVSFTITNFVIHGVSVNNSVNKEIYGNFDRAVDLKFYFDKYDISYYNAYSGEFWNDIYQLGDEYNTEDENLSQIYGILAGLNTSAETNPYLVLNDNTKTGNEYNPISEESKTKITITKNSLTVKEGYNVETINDVETFVPKYLAVLFNVNYSLDDGKWIWTISESNENGYLVDVNYLLNFKMASNWYEPTVIKNSEDFLKMESNENGYYILANDIVLTDYVPKDINIAEFDGNGRTITIQSFGSIDDVDIMAGLFKQIYPNMIVKNVVVNYETYNNFGNYTLGYAEINSSSTYDVTYFDICNNDEISYESVKFGGLAAVNNGVITNCYTTGSIAMRASTVETKVGLNSDYSIDFNIGGLVAENGSTGYITNSTSELSTFAQANIGGFVYSNAGKIVSCGVEKSKTIYAYNNTINTTYVVEVAGFVVNNTSEISMSYVNLQKQDIKDGDKLVNQYGTMSSKDISAGFVYNNSGKIEDAYVEISDNGINNNKFSGFVYHNSGSINHAYSYVNKGLKINNADDMFAPAGTSNITNSAEIVSVGVNYNSGVSGLTTLELSERYTKAKYQNLGFNFGDNKNAIWYINTSNLPRIVATQEKVKYTAGKTFDGLVSFSLKEEIVGDVVNYTYVPNWASYGTKGNPYIIKDLTTWNEYFVDNSTSYYRIVKDIDFKDVGNNPSTSTQVFSGNIQGNNMTLSNIMLMSSSSLESLGLFKQLQGINDSAVQNAVRNLTLGITSVWAAKTQSVGVLAGIVENFNLYNITIDAQGKTIVGGNAVGGLAGVIRGEFDIQQISSNVGVNSTSAQSLYSYSNYMSKNNRVDVSDNLSEVYYAGAVAGIVDGYNVGTIYDINDVRNISNSYYKVADITVEGDINAIGDTVGAAFGLVGERVRVQNVSINISGNISGVQYSAGLVGENRGVIDNVNIVLGDGVFADANYVSAGAVGLNLGGLITNCTVKANIIKPEVSKLVAGVVGRNIYGNVNNVLFDGQLFGYFAGGIIGANYDSAMLKELTTGANALSVNCRDNLWLIPSQQVEYKNGAVPIVNYADIKLSQTVVDYFIDNQKQFYSYEKPTTSSILKDFVITNKVFGLVVGLGSSQDAVVAKVNNAYQVGIEAVDVNGETIKYLVFNPTTSDDKIMAEASENGGKAVLKTETVADNNVEYTFGINTNTLDWDLAKKPEKVYVAYITGSIVQTFDAWNGKYGYTDNNQANDAVNEVVELLVFGKLDNL